MADYDFNGLSPFNANLTRPKPLNYNENVELWRMPRRVKIEKLQQIKDLGYKISAKKPSQFLNLININGLSIQMGRSGAGDRLDDA